MFRSKFTGTFNQRLFLCDCSRAEGTHNLRQPASCCERSRCGGSAALSEGARSGPFPEIRRSPADHAGTSGFQKLLYYESGIRYRNRERRFVFRLRLRKIKTKKRSRPWRRDLFFVKILSEYYNPISSGLLS